MQFNERLSILFKLCLPVLILALINLSPVPRAVSEAWRDVRAARRVDRHEDEARGLRTVLAHQPWRAELWEELGRAELAAGRVEEAVQALSEGLVSGALSADARLLLGELYEQQGQDGAAEAYWRTLLDEPAPSETLRAAAHEHLVSLLRKRGDPEATLAALRAWAADDAQNARAAYLLGLQLAALSPSEALPPLLEASRLDSAYTSSVQTLRNALNLAAAAENPAYGRLLVGRALGSLAQWDLAALAFEQAVELHPTYGEAWAFLGEANHHLGKGGKTELDRAYQLAPESALVRALVSLYWRRHGEPDKALHYLEAIARQEPEEPIWQVEIGNTLVEKGDLPAARERFEKAVMMKPRESIYWQHLARFSISNGVDVGGLGLPAARQAVVLAPSDPAALDLLGWALLNQGDLVTAERILQQAIEKEPSHSLILLHLGQLYLQMQQPERAHPYLARVAEVAGSEAAGMIARRLLKQNFGAAWD